MTDLLSWAAGLGTIPKVLASIIVIFIALFILVVLWSPRPRSVSPGQSSVPTRQQEMLSPEQESVLRAIDDLQVWFTAGKLIIARNGDVALDGTFARPTGVNLVRQLFGESPPAVEGEHRGFVTFMESLPERYIRFYSETRLGSPFVIAVTDEGRRFLHQLSGSSLPAGGGSKGDDITRFMLLYGKLRQEYLLGHDGLSPSMIAGTEPLPEEWVNKMLQELGNPWRVKNTKSGFELYDPTTGASVMPSPPHP